MTTSKARALWAYSLSVIFGVLLAASVSAHSFNESYVYFDVTETTLSGRVEVGMVDLAKFAARDADVHEPITKEDLNATFDTVTRYFGERMELVYEGQRLDVTFRDVSDLTYLDTEKGKFAQLWFDVGTPAITPVEIEMFYNAFFDDIDPDHRGYALIATNTRNGMTENEGYISLIFSPGDVLKRFYLNDERTSDAIMTFIEHGIWHIWLGFDHVLFIVTLLISSVMFIQAGRWEPSTQLRQSLWNTVKIVTVFTLAHTVTLSLATFGIVTLTATFVEAVIAVSIAVVAIGNLVPRFHTTSWIVVFVFGLFHGFGFANVLEPLGLDTERKAIGLAAFNIGVELGQLAIVLVLFPIFYKLRNWSGYRPIAMQAGSVVLIAVAVFWFVERTIGSFGAAQVAGLGG
ncbi:MAG: HupE/UreJ family protein [Rhodobacteraceae bacterium]|nr:HupE/UreJ family protein [Paracoccaceae bacterium]